MAKAWVFTACLLTGCGTIQYYPDLSSAEATLSEAAGEVTDDGAVVGTGTVDGEALVITGVEPAYATDRGGEELTVHGGPFHDDVVVRVDGEVAEILRVDDDAVTFVSPPAGLGEVDLQVEVGDASATLPGAVRIWEDASGLVGLTGTLALVDTVGDYWETPPSDAAFAALAVVEPVAYESWQEYAPAFNSCAIDHVPPALDVLDGGAALLVAGSTEVDLEGAGDGWLEAEMPLAAGDEFDLVSEAGEGWEAVEIPGLVRLPEGLEVTGPDIGRDLLAVPRQFDLQWDVTGAADYVAIVMDRTVWDGTTYVHQETLSCAVPDTGAFTLPGALWGAWAENEVVFVRIGRIRESTVTLPHNHADVAVTGAYWVSGAVLAGG